MRARKRGAKDGELMPSERRVLDALQRACRPLSAYALLAELRGPGVSAPTQIYRVLNRLISKGHVHRIETLNAYTCCDSAAVRTYTAFVICRDCGQVDAIDDGALGDAMQRLAEAHHFATDLATIELRGRCAGCSEAEHAHTSQT